MENCNYVLEQYCLWYTVFPFLSILWTVFRVTWVVQEGSKEAFVECLEMGQVFFICHSIELYFPEELLSFELLCLFYR